MMKTTKKGFTLAEVLTTLMVIGVVAAMTIPTLMNSTNEQQLKVAYKKAMSVLGQGVQLMIAKEEECEVNNDAELAQCFADHVLAGSVVQGYNASATGKGGSRSATDTDNNTIVTSDGMAYAFYFTGTATGTGTKKNLEDICGSSLGSTEKDFDGTNAKCLVIVDVNGLGKGAKRIAKQTNTTAGTAAALTSSDFAGSEQQAMVITGNAVRPVFGSSLGDYNNGYKWMYGEMTSGATPWSSTSTTTSTSTSPATTSP